MNRVPTFVVMLILLGLTASVLPTAQAQVPARIAYQGLALDAPGAALEDGTYRVTFRLYDQQRGGKQLWEEQRTIDVESGLFSVFLGEQKAFDLPFDAPYWLSIELEGQPESAPMPLSAAPYSLMARSLADSALVAGPGIEIQRDGAQFHVAIDPALYSQLQGGTAPRPHTTAGSAADPDAIQGAGGSNTGLDAAYDAGRVITVDGNEVIINSPAGNATVPLQLKSLDAGAPILEGFGSDGGAAEIEIDDEGGIQIKNNLPNNFLSVYIDPNGTGNGGEFNLYDEGVFTAVIESDGSGDGAELRLTQNDAGTSLRTAELEAHGADTGAELRLYFNDAGTTRKTVELEADGANDAGVLRMFRKGTADPTVELFAGEASAEGSSLFLRDAAGNITIEMDADFEGDGRVITEELAITGGSDLSENFDITGNFGIVEPLPGMVVSIDPSNPGRLTISGTPYDRMVAGIISGAGGIETGLIMGQQGSVADGDFPVALTGRVYVYVDASYGSVSPGDLLTSSATPGHAMKVRDYGRSQGAILGKAMSGLSSGQGLVLVLVSLQ